MEALDAELLALLRRKHRERPPHLVLASGPSALEFAERYHEDLWPGAALIFSLVEERALAAMRIRHAAGGIPMRFEFARTLELALALRPKTRRVVFVGGTTAFDIHFVALARTAVAEFPEGWRPGIWWAFRSGTSSRRSRGFLRTPSSFR